MKIKAILAFVLIVALSSCKTQSKTITDVAVASSDEISDITKKAPYNPKPGMEKLKSESKNEDIHFLVFGDSKGSDKLPSVLKIADALNPQFCITTADLVNKGGGDIGVKLYQELDKTAGWFFRKYPTWPTLGNHEVGGPKTNTRKKNYDSGVANFGDFFGLKDPFYSFTYKNAKFIALDWIKVSKSPERLAWLEKELKEAAGKHIFVFKHRPYYTVGHKSYKDVKGESTVATKLFSKYNVTAVFSGHDHIYYRTKREGVIYMVSAGAGAQIYDLKREKDAIEGDAYYGRTIDMDSNEFKFHAVSGEETKLDKPMFYVVSVKVEGDKISFEMIDANGKSWDKFTF
ncbi:MAG: metallophosphoesterase [Flavobacteriaceae bacterium]|nr:metallophosphoesterase [Flavobacteriaceae bacterium]